MTSKFSTTNRIETRDEDRVCGYGASEGVESTRCACPIDWQGETCNVARARSCQPILVSPQPLCSALSPSDSTPPSSTYSESDSSSSQPTRRVVYGDPACFVFKRASDQPVFEYRLDCRFLDSEEDTTEAADDEGSQDSSSTNQTDLGFPYPYWFKGTTFQNRTFGITASPNVADQWNLLLKVFNFNRLSDLSASQIVQLNPAQILGQQTIPLTLPLASYTHEYLTGGRLYFEVSVATNDGSMPVGMTSTTRLIDARFVDFQDYHGTGTTSYQPSLAAWKIVLIIASVFFGLIIIAQLLSFFYRRYRRQQKDQLKKKK